MLPPARDVFPAVCVKSARDRIPVVTLTVPELLIGHWMTAVPEDVERTIVPELLITPPAAMLMKLPPVIVAVWPAARLIVLDRFFPVEFRTTGPFALLVPVPVSDPLLHVYVPATVMLSAPWIVPVWVRVVTLIASPLLKLTVPPTVSVAPSEVSVAAGLNVAVPPLKAELVIELKPALNVAAPPDITREDVAVTAALNVSDVPPSVRLPAVTELANICVPPPNVSPLPAAVNRPVCVPSPLRFRVPLVTLTVPVLFIGHWMTAVPEDVERRIVPELLSAPAAAKNPRSFWMSIVPALLITPPAAMFMKLPPVITAGWPAPSDSVLARLFPETDRVNVPPGEIVVVPAPSIVPLVQTRVPPELTFRSPAPVTPLGSVSVAPLATVS